MDLILPIPNVYDANQLARGECRQPTKLLDEKFSYFGGKNPNRPKESLNRQSIPDFRKKFTDSYRLFVQNVENNAEAGYQNIARLLPNMLTLNPHVLAAGAVIVDNLRLSKLEDLTKKAFDSQFERNIWPNLNSILSKNKASTKERTAFDVYRYVKMILMFMEE